MFDWAIGVFRGSVLEIGAQIIHVTPKAPSKINPQVPVALDRITLKMLQKKVEDRYQSAGELLNDLKTVAPSLGGNGVPVASKSVKPTDGFKRATNAFATLTMQLRRQRFSLVSVIATFAIAGLAIFGLIYLWPRSYYQPPPAALKWYESGTTALRNGAYLQASRAFEQAIATDSNFALARAHLAQAYVELDYVDRAKDELLAVQTLTRKLAISPQDTLYLDAITAMARREFTEATRIYTQIAEHSPNEPHVYVDLGYAYENDGNPDKALENYLKAIPLNNGQYATAYLRAGIIYLRRSDAKTPRKCLTKPSNCTQLGVTMRESTKYGGGVGFFREVWEVRRCASAVSTVPRLCPRPREWKLNRLLRSSI